MTAILSTVKLSSVLGLGTTIQTMSGIQHTFLVSFVATTFFVFILLSLVYCMFTVIMEEPVQVT